MTTIVVAALALAVLVVPSPAAAAECMPAGGQDRPFEPDPDHDRSGDALTLVGGGWGHGVGMSQYGAKGAALLGCTYRQILGTYYTDSTVEALKMPAVVRVGLWDPSTQGSGGIGAALTAESGDVRWRIDFCETAGACATQPPVQRQGETWVVRSESNGTYVIRRGDGTRVWRGGDRFGLLDARHNGTIVKIGTPALVRRSRWGFTRFDSVASGAGMLYVVEHITSSRYQSGMQRYLWGLAEVPSSWPTESLKSQAVAARSYASNRIGVASRFDRCRCDLYATTVDQHWTGWDHQAADRTVGSRWVKAVKATPAEVARYRYPDSGAEVTVDAFYSSSHGGWSEDVSHVFGATVPYLRAVDTSRWETAPGVDNPLQRWTEGFTADDLENRLGFAQFESLTIERRGPGGRPTVQDGGGAVARGRNAAGELVSVRMTGEQLRSRLSLYSSLVHVHEDLPDVPVTRLVDAQVPDRMGTSAAIARRGWKSSTWVVLARSDDPADALAGAALAGKLHAPLLITPTAELHPAIASEIRRLGATKAWLLGGTAALAPRVERDLREVGVTEQHRAQGATRVETAVAIADVLAPAEGGSAYLVFSSPGDPGRGWPDALSISATAARRASEGKTTPIYVTDGGLPDATMRALRRHGVSRVVLIGGEAVLPSSTIDALRRRGYVVDRIAGDDRYATSLEVAKANAAGSQRLLIATGEAFPDGLSAGALAAELDMRVLLVPRTVVRDDARTWVRSLGWDAPGLLVAGGTAAVSDDVVAGIRRALAEGAR